MKILVTGSHGTLGQALCQHLREQGHCVVGWDRTHVSTEHYAVMDAYIRGVAPDVLFHLAVASALPSSAASAESWRINHDWPSELAWICRQQGIRFVFTSTALVFSNAKTGPFDLAAEPDAAAGYGYEKRMAEQRVLAQNPDSRVVRLGWQIGEHAGSNNMVDFLERQMQAQGHIAASSAWYPACSFLPDTCAALLQVQAMPPGLYMADSNRHWAFFEIVQALAQQRGAHWQVQANTDYIYDQRLLDPRLVLPPLSVRLPGLVG